MVIRSSHAEHGTSIVIHQIKYFNNIVKQDHQGVKRITHLILGCKSFDAAQCYLVNVKTKYILKKMQTIAKEEKKAARQPNSFMV